MKYFVHKNWIMGLTSTVISFTQTKVILTLINYLIDLKLTLVWSNFIVYTKKLKTFTVCFVQNQNKFRIFDFMTKIRPFSESFFGLLNSEVR